MAVFAYVAGQNVVLILARCFSAIVATNTIGRVIRVIKRRRYPAIGRMAGVTVIAAGYAALVFADGNRIVMTR